MDGNKIVMHVNHLRMASSTVLSKAILYLIFINCSLSSVTFNLSESLVSDPVTLMVDYCSSRSNVLFSLSLFKVIFPEFDIPTFFLGVTNSFLSLVLSFNPSFIALSSWMSSTLIPSLKISFSVLFSCSNNFTYRCFKYSMVSCCSLSTLWVFFSISLT